MTDIGATSRNQGANDCTNLAFNFFRPFTFEDGVVAVEQKLAKMVNFMTLPVFDTLLEIVDSVDSLLLMNSFVRTCKDRFCRCNTVIKIFTA